MQRRAIPGLVLLAATSFLAACGGGAGHGAEQALSACSIPPTFSALPTADRSIPTGATGAQLCSFGKRRLLPFEPAKGVRVDQVTARVIASLLNAAPPSQRPERSCRELKDDNGVTIRFTYARTSPYEVGLVYFGCPSPFVFGLSTTRIPKPTISDFVVSAANSFASKPGTARAPELIGDDISTAERVAAASGYSLASGSEEISPLHFGTVLFQIPPAGLRGTFGNQIAVTIAVQHSPPCDVGSLAGTYVGGGPQSGSDYGEVVIRNVGPRPCDLKGPISIVGVSGSGTPLTNTVTLSVPSALILTPNAPPLPSPNLYTVPGEVWSLSQLGAPYENPVTRQPCVQVVPARWQLTIGGSVLSVDNVSENPGFPGFGSLITCGSFSASPS